MGKTSIRQKRLALRHHPLAVACAAAFLLASNASNAEDLPAAPATADANADAAAQDPVPQTEEEKAAEARRKAAAAEAEAKEIKGVQVTGIRGSIENSISKKKDANQIVEVISAEDIGKLPDSSIAESLQRTSGLAAQRVAGRASTISIRGLSPNFSTTLLNGRDQVSVGDNRGVEYDQYPSELINGVTIYKTTDAKLVGQGLSGTVDLQTLNPLDFNERKFAVNARWEQNSLGEVNPGYSDTGNRLSFTYIDQFADNTLGIAFGIARLDSPGQNSRWRSWGYPTDTVNGTPNVQIIGGSQLYSSSTENVRTGIVGVIEYRPSDTWTSKLDIFYSKFDKTETTRGMETALFAGWGGGTLSNAVVEDGVLVQGTFTGVRPVLRNDQNKSDDSIFSIGWKNEWKLNDDWTAVLDLSMSKATRNDRYLELYAGRVDNADNPLTDTVTYTLNDDGLPTFVFGADYTNPAVVRLTDSSGWGQSGYVKSPEVEDELHAFRLDLRRDFVEGPLTDIQFGVNYADREKSRASIEYYIDLVASPSAIPSDLIEESAENDLTGGTPVIAFDLDGLFDSGLYTLRQQIGTDIYNKNWTVNEEVWTAYGQVNFDSEWGSVPVRGNVGLQVVHTDQSSDGFATANNGAIATPYTAGDDYIEYLPSLNLAFSFAHDQTVRFAAARQMARARMDQMRASNSYSCNSGGQAPPGFCRWSGGGGNPALRPILADSFDLSYEKYFGVKAYVGLAAFYKSLNSWVTNADIPFDYTGFVVPQNLVPIRNIDNFNTPINVQGGSIHGLEFTLSLPFNLLSESFDGFGLVFNASDTHGRIPDGLGGERPIDGLSNFVANTTLYYEKYGFSARISQSRRTAFLGEVTGFGADREFHYIRPESIVSFQTSYEFQEGSSLEGLSILLQVNNLTNEPYGEYDGTPNTPRLYGEYGRTVLFGANYKF